VIKWLDYIPEFAANGKGNITIAQVLTHTAGFPNPPPDWTLPKWADWDASIARICAQTLNMNPETRTLSCAYGSWTWRNCVVSMAANAALPRCAEICTVRLG
jgi:CubicO group peptidase (beta-lactamase class C family)